MALNAFMHPRNIYRIPPDFKVLVDKYPDVRKHMITDIMGKTRYDFGNPEALRVMTRTLLHKDFDLDVHIPPDKLVPTLPNRLNYVLWLEDLIASLKLPDDEPPHGLDVGTGPCAVYALLGARRGWRMAATERDVGSLKTARDNVSNNQLQEQIQVLEADSTLLTGPLEAVGPVHFTLCNPPFFDSENDAGSEARERRPPPLAAPTGLLHEVSCPGGERAFVGRLISESSRLTDQCRIFTTMLGHKSSVRPLKRAMYEAGAAEVITTELCQGNTKRWAIGWTFRRDLNLNKVVAMKQKKKRAPVQCVVPRNMSEIQYNVPDVKQHVVNWLQELQMEVEPGKCNKYFASYKVTAMEDTWTHARRRRRAQQRQAAAAAAATSDLEPSPSSADLASPDQSADPASTPDRPANLSVASDTSDLSEPVPKRARSGSGDSAAPDDERTVKRPCLSTELGAVSLHEAPAMANVADAEDADGKAPRRRPALVFTLFVQRRDADILLLLTLLTGPLGAQGVNDVLLYLRNQMRQRIAGAEAAGVPSGSSATAAGLGPAAASSSVVEGMGRLLSHIRSRMRQKISLEATPVPVSHGEEAEAAIDDGAETASPGDTEDTAAAEG